MMSTNIMKFIMLAFTKYTVMIELSPTISRLQDQRPKIFDRILDVKLEEGIICKGKRLGDGKVGN
jgi:hypothetical protein